METPPPSALPPEEPQTLALVIGLAVGLFLGFVLAIVGGFIAFGMRYGHSGVEWGGLIATVVVIAAALAGLTWWYRRGVSGFAKGFVIGAGVSVLLGGSCVGLMFGGA